MRRLLQILALLAVPVLAMAQTKAAQSAASPVVFVYAPGFGIVGAVLDPSITVTCTPQGICTIKAVLPAAPTVPVSVGCEPYAVTATQSVFPLKFTPATPVLVHKNGVLLENIGGLDYSLAGATVTLTSAQTAQPGDSICFQYSH